MSLGLSITGDDHELIDLESNVGLQLLQNRSCLMVRIHNSSKAKADENLEPYDTKLGKRCEVEEETM